MLAWLNDISYELKFPFVGSGDFKIYIYKEKETKGMKNEMKKKNNKGFSLVELIVVIAIMAVLMVVLAPAMLRYVEKTRVQKDNSALGEVTSAVSTALADERVYAEAKGGDITITINGTASPVSYNYANSASGAVTTLLQAEVDATIGSLSMSAKTHMDTGSTYTIKARYDGGRSTYVVGGHWDDNSGESGDQTAFNTTTTP